MYSPEIPMRFFLYFLRKGELSDESESNSFFRRGRPGLIGGGMQ
jgi:hypothetical protein